jgi:sulfide:quinone oxidoreductase
MLNRPRVVVVGGGFAGLRVLRRLKDLAEITLVESRMTSLAKPALPEVAMEGKPVDHVRFPLAHTVRRSGAELVTGRVERIDTDRRYVVLHDGTRVPYDYLVVAAGAVKDYAAIAGFSSYGFSVCDDEQAPKLFNALQGFTGGPVVVGSAPSRWGSRVVVPRLLAACEGPVGEVAFMLAHDFARRGIGAPVTVFSPGQVFFDDVGDKVHAEVGPLLDEAHITVTTGRDVVEIGPDHVAFADGSTLDSALAIVIPPYAAPAFIAESGLGDEAGFMPVDKAMRHLDAPRVLGAGDATALSMPKLGHIAVHQADIASAAIRSEVTGLGDVPPYEPEIFCIMNRGGAEATLILSDYLYGGRRDIAYSGPLARLLKWSFDEYDFHTRGHLPPDRMQQVLEWVLRETKG